MTDAVYDLLRRYVDFLDVPAGIGPVEISDGQIVMTLSPSRRHALAARRLRRELEPQVPLTHPGFVPENGPEIEDPHRGILRRPDLVVVREEVLDEEGGGVHPADVLPAAEIVSPSNPDNDYVGKMRDYPAMGIAHYLIVDPRSGTVHHHAEPLTVEGRPAYSVSRTYPFGATVEVGEWTLDTGVFPRYGARD